MVSGPAPASAQLPVPVPSDEGSTPLAPAPTGAGKRLTATPSPRVINGIAGALAGALTATFVCPLDVLKTRLQIQRLGTGKEAGGIWGGLRSIVRVEGARGLYRGLSPTLLALLPNWAVYFTVYESLKISLTTRPDGSRMPATAAMHMTSAAAAGASTILVTNPLWVVKTRLQTQTMTLHLGPVCAVRNYTGAFNALRRISAEEGIRGMYSGLAPSLAGIFHVAIQFPLYEHAKVLLAQRPGHIEGQDLSLWELGAASGLSKTVASVVTYPHEVVRSYMHVSGSGPLSGLSDACRIIYREDGLKGFYRGCGTNLYRTVPAAAITFTSYELIARLLRKFAGDRQAASETVAAGRQQSGSTAAALR